MIYILNASKVFEVNEARREDDSGRGEGDGETIAKVVGGRRRGALDGLAF